MLFTQGIEKGDAMSINLLGIAGIGAAILVVLVIGVILALQNH